MGAVVPLNRPALPVAPGPRSVQRARQWVVETLANLGRHDLVETAELGVSELVTNAVLHGEAPMSVRVRGTLAHPRVEVRDASPEAPLLPQESSVTMEALDALDSFDEGDVPLLTTFGRGLEIVARSSDAWGADIDESGKVVWFVPAARMRDDPVDPVMSGDAGSQTTEGEGRTFRVLRVPLAELAQFEHHYRELGREVRLLALAHGSQYPFAKPLGELLVRMQRELRDGIDGDSLREASVRGTDVADLDVRLTHDTTRRLDQFLELLDVADEFCRQQRMLSVARSPEQKAFQEWFLSEFLRQSEGRPPTPYDDCGLHAQA